MRINTRWMRARRLGGGGNGVGAKSTQGIISLGFREHKGNSVLLAKF
jgi:hypothetical protein